MNVQHLIECIKFALKRVPASGIEYYESFNITVGNIKFSTFYQYDEGTELVTKISVLDNKEYYELYFYFWNSAQNQKIIKFKYNQIINLNYNIDFTDDVFYDSNIDYCEPLEHPNTDETYFSYSLLESDPVPRPAVMCMYDMIDKFNLPLDCTTFTFSGTEESFNYNYDLTELVLHLRELK